MESATGVQPLEMVFGPTPMTAKEYDNFINRCIEKFSSEHVTGKQIVEEVKEKEN